MPTWPICIRQASLKAASSTAGAKTGKLYDIKITPDLRAILDHYIDLTPDSPYIFPILKRHAPEHQDKDIQWARKKYNDRLKDLAKHATSRRT